jgi:hypothetical protein
MKSFKWMIAGCSILIGALLLSTQYSTVTLNEPPIKKTVQSAPAAPELQESEFPILDLGLQLYRYY